MSNRGKTSGKSSGKQAVRKTGGSTSRKRKPDKRTLKKKKQFIRDEAAAIITAFLAVFLMLSNFSLLGKAGAFFGSMMKGLFGAAAYAFPVFILIITAYVISKRGTALFGLKTTSLFVLFFALTGLMQLIFGAKEILLLKDAYELAGAGEFFKKACGGAVGAAVAGGIQGVLGRIGAYLMLTVLLLIGIVILTEKSVVGFARESAEKTYEAARRGGVRARARLYEERVRREARREAEALRRKEESLERAVREDTGKPEPRLSADRFDLKAGKAEEYAVYGRDIIESNAVSKNTDVPFSRQYYPMAEEGALDITRVISIKPEEDVPSEPDYSVDEVPFFETAEDKYKAYGKMLGSGRIDIKAAEGMGFAVSRSMDGSGTYSYGTYKNHSEDTESREPRSIDAFIEKAPDQERHSGYLDDGVDEENDNLHAPAEPDSIVYPEAGGEEFSEAPAAMKKTPEQAQAELDRKRAQEKRNPAPVKRPYQFPPVSLLAKGNKMSVSDSVETRENAVKLRQVLESFGVGVTVTNVVRGPRVTRYEVTPDIGVKVSRITALSGDIKLALAARELRIEAPIPGKSAVGIELPNKDSATVTFRDIMDTAEFREAKSKLTWGVGLDIQGSPVIGDIAKMPHLLVAGTTGSGKSVGINSIIMSVIYRSKPEDVRLILIDPKVVELSVYDGIPHLLTPVVTKPSEALAVLNKACEEMNRRYRLFKESNTRNIKGYNEKAREVSEQLAGDVEKPEKLPYILIIIDELSELMMHSKRDVESAIVSLTQLARAAGIHLVTATQRPSVDVVTGLIKSNIPSRVAYRLPSGIDSRTVLDSYGAETLLGNGDMLYKPGDKNSPLRVQGAFLSDAEVENIVEWLRKHNSVSYDDEWEDAMTALPPADSGGAGMEMTDPSSDGRDEYFYDAGCLITDKKKASIGMLQRKFKVGFNRAARIMEQLNDAGVVSDGEGTKERQVLMTNEEFARSFGDGNA